ncbi:unnamed protein product [Clonostachys rosea f. rosea IK726]|uniref:Uncharacterized protein n=1 Tax=Clonostachys rosea f. rosea IK726 TaxID=1349383 RepID=A0ACA9TUD3_BIOOC|nr:unnamed protein product [Clonostachys rosea f. rosea IK726]
MLRQAVSATAAHSRSQLPRVIFSGIQPTGIPHLGNYAGALSQWVQLQDTEPSTSKLIFSVVDLHAITTPQPPQQLRQWRREALAALLAIGLHPDRATIFFQSSGALLTACYPKVPAHSELMWILSCTASVGYLSRMTQWKSKLSLDNASSLDDRGVGSKLKLGLFSYPVLQAADILVHRATHVPVGHDQKQHLEFARECVTNFNHAYGDHLVQPETLISPVHRVMSLTDPSSKMSKSHKLDRSRILITDSPEQIKAKIGSALTDSIPGISYDIENRPGISNLLSILSLFDDRKRSAAQLGAAYSDLSPKQFKQIVSEAIIQGFGSVRERYLELLSSDNDYLEKVAAEGARKANQSAEETMSLVREAVGF